MPVIGHAYAVMGLDFRSPMYRAVERFVFLPDGSGFEAFLSQYNGIDADMFRDEELFNHQIEHVDAFVRTHVMQNKAAFTDPSDYYRALAGGKWTEEPDATLFYLLLRSPERKFGKILAKMRNGTRCYSLSRYLRDIAVLAQQRNIEETKLNVEQ